MSTDEHRLPDVPELNRRRFLHGGALLAGVVGAGVAAVAAAPAADAADGDPVTLGTAQTSSSTTSITIDAGAQPVLGLSNADGPVLHLDPLLPDWAGELAIGDIVNTDLGPVLGVDTTNGPSIAFLATSFDLEDLPTPFAVTPARLLDTRTTDRSGVLANSPAAFDTTGRLNAGAWIDVRISPAPGDYTITAAQLNITVTGSATGGYATVYAPGPDPGTSTINFSKGQTIANAAYTPAGVLLGHFAIRVRASAATHVILDFTGGAVQGRSNLPSTSGTAARRTKTRSTLLGKVQQAIQRSVTR